MAGRRFVKGAIPVLLHPERLNQPLGWRKPRRVFVCSLADLFHEAVPDEFIDHVFATMALAPQHTFQLLSKRPERMREYIGKLSSSNRIWPLENYWLGVSAENQRMAEQRIPILLDTPAAVRFVSCEPLLGPLDLRKWLQPPVYSGYEGTNSYEYPPLDWVLVGGESGGPENRRLVEYCCRKGSPFGPPQREHDIYRPRETICETFNRNECQLFDYRPKPQALEWMRRIRDDCQAAGVSLLVKGWGGPKPSSGGRVLDGKIWHQFPRQGGEQLAMEG